MPKTGSASKIKIDSFDDLFGSSVVENPNQTEQVVEVPLKDLHTFKNHALSLLLAVLFFFGFLHHNHQIHC